MSQNPRTIIVTGAAQGIGLAVATRFAADGGSVLLADIDPKVEDEAARLQGEKATVKAVVGDVSNSRDVDRIVESALAWTGRLDVVVNNAGIHRWFGSVSKVDEADWDRTMAVNLRSMYLMSRRAFPALASSRGAIVNVASIIGHVVGSTVSLPYAASKAGVVGFTHSFALEAAQAGVRVNCVCPGPIDTQLTRRSFDAVADGDGSSGSKLTAFLASIPLGRLGTADDIACAVNFLASQEASFMTGAAMVIDGGYSVR